MSQEYCRAPVGEGQRVLVVGGGDVGVELARRLAEGWQVTIMDLDTEPARTALAQHGGLDNITFHEGDATSRLQLEQAGAPTADTIVLTVKPDDVALEVGRVLRRDFANARVVALLRQAEMAAQFDAMAIPYVHDFEAVTGTLIGRVTQGSRVATDVGLGMGEIIETEIMPNSSIIDKPLSLLKPHRWLIAAVYRENALVVPHGDTTLKEGDRVLLVGDPNILPCIARFLATGHSEFPLAYGAGIGILAPGRKSDVAREAEYLLTSTHAEFAELLEEGAEPELLETLRNQFADPELDLRLAQVDGVGSGPLAAALETRDLGLVVLRPPKTTLAERLGIRRSSLLQRLSKVAIPTLIARGSHPYRSIMLAIGDLDFDAGTANLAIDVARMLGATLTVVVATPPDFVAGTSFAGDMDVTLESTVELARSYGLTAKVIKLTGNPVRQVLAAATKFDLAVVGWPRNARVTFLRPRVEQSLVHLGTCSVLVLPG